MAPKPKIDATLDTTEAVESDFEPKVLVDKGTYLAVVSAAELTTSKKSKTPMVVIEFSIKGGKFSGEKLKVYAVLRGKGSGFTRKKLLAFYTDEEMGEGFKVDPDALIGEKAIITVDEDFYTHEEYVNKNREDGKFETRKITNVLSAADESAVTAAQITANTQKEENNEEPPF